ncbi:glycosyltransferase family 2 protein [Mesorhizobium sp. LNJC403B00]|uniref:glycosyltransferase family 2 protein n=1 Tax=Mesorhizobium sp. LNJC403B00 TaxID=1287280 RepID=UPI0003CE8D2A|nr:glycosyltransferase family 2 protein [Mesorhizobium sp. LNJC403B00]ESX94040.1 glycosyl transferase family A [Mesorhizobium sp. LNJC403B00]
MKDISVIIPAHNAGRSIASTIRSLASEADLIEEILIVDDGSTDGTAEIAEQTGRQSGLPVLVKRVARFQAGAARNVGIKMAVSPWLYFIDADDIHMKDGLRNLLRKGTEHGSTGIVVGSYIRRTDGVDRLIDAPAGYGLSKLENAGNYLIDKCETINVGAALIRSLAIGTVRFPEGVAYEEDTLFWARLLTQAGVDKMPDPVLTYQISTERADNRLLVKPATQFFIWRKALRELGTVRIDEDTLRRREALLAIKIARVHYLHGSFRTAERFLMIARPLPKTARTQWRFWRYRLKLWLNRSTRTPEGPGGSHKESLDLRT